MFIRCRKINISLVFITQSYFSVPKDVRLNSTHYLIMKINNKKELQKIAINDSSGIDYFIKIYRECTKEPYNFLTKDTMLPASLNRKIMQNEAQYDLDRKAAKISALSSNYLDKYEHLTGEDFGLKPSTVEQVKFEYSPLGKIFNKGLSKDDKKEGLFKRLENIKDKNEEHLQAIKDQGEKQLKKLKNIDKSKTLKATGKFSKKNDEANKLLSEFRKIDETLDNAELVCTKTDGTKYNFNIFPLEFIEKVHNYEITLDEAMDNEEKLEKLIIRLENYGAKSNKKRKEK